MLSSLNAYSWNAFLMERKHSIDRILFLCFLTQLAFPTSVLATSSVEDLEEESMNKQPADSAAEEPGADGSI